MKKRLSKEQLKAIFAKGYTPKNGRSVTLRIPEGSMEKYERLRGSSPPQAKTLSVIRSSDGKYRFIGSIQEDKLEEERKQGFKTYQDALDAMKKYGYTLYDGKDTSPLPKRTQKEIDKDWKELIAFEEVWRKAVNKFGVGQYTKTMQWVANELGVSFEEAERQYGNFLYPTPTTTRAYPATEKIDEKWEKFRQHEKEFFATELPRVRAAEEKAIFGKSRSGNSLRFKIIGRTEDNPKIELTQYAEGVTEAIKKAKDTFPTLIVKEAYQNK